jgi:hypothetical protein
VAGVPLIQLKNFIFELHRDVAVVIASVATERHQEHLAAGMNGDVVHVRREADRAGNEDFVDDHDVTIRFRRKCATHAV